MGQIDIPATNEKFSMILAENSAKWDEFVENSAEGTIFSTHYYLNLIGIKYRNFFIIKGNENCAGVSFLISPDDPRKIYLHSCVIYGGIMFAKASKDQNLESILTAQFEITEYVISELVKSYNTIALSLSPNFTDLRPFLWYNYYNESSGKFVLSLRYTSILNLNMIIIGVEETEWPFFKTIGYSRRQLVRYARKDGIAGLLSDDAGILTELYVMSMARQEIPITPEFARIMTSVVQTLTKDKRGYLFVVKNNSGKNIGAAFFCCDQKRAYYLWGAMHPDEKDSYSGTILLWDAFIFLRRLGIQEIDLEGVNSPHRGWFKLSFGGSLNPYFHVSLKV